MASKQRCEHGIDMSPIKQKTPLQRTITEFVQKTQYEEAERTAGDGATKDEIIDVYMSIHKEFLTQHPELLTREVASAMTGMCIDALVNGVSSFQAAQQWRQKALAIVFCIDYTLEKFFTDMAEEKENFVSSRWGRALAANAEPDTLKKALMDETDCGCLGCRVCGKTPATARCSLCKVHYYCGKDCQKKAWKEDGHKKLCKGAEPAPPHEHSHEGGCCSGDGGHAH